MIYHIYANRSNIGDWLSAKGIQKLLSPLPITECLCDDPFVEETMQVLSNATEDDLIVIGGGGLLMDYFIPFWKAFRPVADRIPFVIWGIGCCDLKNEDSLPPLSLIEEIVRKSKLCIVRDELTRAFLRNCDIPAPVPCPCINVVEPYERRGPGFLHVANYSTAGAEIYEAMRTTGEKYAESHGLVFRETNNRINKDSTEEMNRVLLTYQKSGIVLSSALHGCIIAVAMGLKVLAVSGDRKIEGFMHAAGLQDWLLDISEVDRMKELLEKLNSQITPVDTLAEIREKNHQVAQSIFKLVKSYEVRSKK